MGGIIMYLLCSLVVTMLALMYLKQITKLNIYSNATFCICVFVSVALILYPIFAFYGPKKIIDIESYYSTDMTNDNGDNNDNKEIANSVNNREPNEINNFVNMSNNDIFRDKSNDRIVLELNDEFGGRRLDLSTGNISLSKIPNEWYSFRKHLFPNELNRLKELANNVTAADVKNGLVPASHVNTNIYLYKNDNRIVLQQSGKSSVQIPEIRDLILELISIDNAGFYWDSSIEDGLVYAVDNTELPGMGEKYNDHYSSNNWVSYQKN